MTSTIDVKVNFNAIPEYARTIAAQQSEEVQKYSRDHDRSRQENIQRDHQVNEPQKPDPSTNIPGSGKRGQVAAQSGQVVPQRRSESRNGKDIPETYTPQGGKTFFKSAVLEEGAGRQINLKA